jgi:hypothetical protein
VSGRSFRGDLNMGPNMPISSPFIVGTYILCRVLARSKGRVELDFKKSNNNCD